MRGMSGGGSSPLCSGGDEEKGGGTEANRVGERMVGGEEGEVIKTGVDSSGRKFNGDSFWVALTGDT